MGLMRFLSSESKDKGTIQPPNPNPFKFKILATEQFGDYCVVEATYEGCTTYSGHKTLVYKDRAAFIRSRTELDPHFLENTLSPIARFPGGFGGWRNAQKFAQMKMSEKRVY